MVSSTQADCGLASRDRVTRKLSSNQIRIPGIRPTRFAAIGVMILGSHLWSGTVRAETESGQPAARSARVQSRLDLVDAVALRRAVEDLSRTYPGRYPDGNQYLKEITHLEERLPTIRQGVAVGDPEAAREAEEALALHRRALLANPLLDFERLLLIRRKPLGDPRRSTGDADNDKGLGKFLGLPQQSSWQVHAIEKTDDWDNEIAVLTDLTGETHLKLLYRPTQGRLISEMDLHFDGERLMFSMPDEQGQWQVHEIGVDGTGLRKISGDGQPDVHNFDSCYLPDNRIAYVSTAPFQGVPCNASLDVGMIYLMDDDGGNIRQLCFEQDHNFCPTVMADGRILYLRWEYTDIPHVWARFLFTMNPDGTTQREFYGSGGYWPNAIFFARPVPNRPNMVAGIVTGHHVGRVGELVLFDVAKGRKETEGVVQRIPGFGQNVEPLIEDKLALNSFPKVLHPWPLSEQYFLAACKPRPDDLWGIYLVDVFDNLLCLAEREDYALLEPIPLRAVERPPVIPDKVDLRREDANVYLENIYQGPGLRGVPRGTVKQLRLFSYHFAYNRLAGINHRVGVDGPWEPKRVLGTVPVEPDGSAMFRVPANTPISIQPLDANGSAVQLMRSWTTAMPGENVSCSGCHEQQNSAPPSKKTLASGKSPMAIEPWHGPVRGFSFRREVQPVLERHCVICHDGGPRDDGLEIPDLRENQDRFVVVNNSDPTMKVVTGIPREELVKTYAGVFDPAYIELRRHVRVGGFESDLHLLNPYEFHVSTSPLIQMLRKGHHGVRLSSEGWDRLTTWIDLNTPCHGTWQDIAGIEPVRNDRARRLALRARYGSDTIDPEVLPAPGPKASRATAGNHVARPAVQKVAGWPFSDDEARDRQTALGPTTRTLHLGEGVTLDLVRVPAGHFVMGSAKGHPDEWPPGVVDIGSPFWIGRFEVSNEQFRRFAPEHDSRFEHKGSWVFSEHHLGWPLNQPRQPVVRVSWEEAQAFCRWISERTGVQAGLPTEAQWEWACRAGSAGPLSFGGLDDDFSPFANLADATVRELAYDTDGRFTVDLLPRDGKFTDGQLVTAHVGSFQPNAWGLHDMHGNAWEWTQSCYRAYPYRGNGRNDARTEGERVVRGGSWYDRPQRARSGYRLSYEPWQQVFNVGFRIVVQVGNP